MIKTIYTHFRKVATRVCMGKFLDLLEIVLFVLLRVDARSLTPLPYKAPLAMWLIYSHAITLFASVAYKTRAKSGPRFRLAGSHAI